TWPRGGYGPAWLPIGFSVNPYGRIPPRLNLKDLGAIHLGLVAEPACAAALDLTLTRLGNIEDVAGQSTTNLDIYDSQIRLTFDGYDAVNLDRLSDLCVNVAAIPIESALNQYIDADNAWI